MEESDIRDLFAHNLKKTRKSHGLSQAELAEKIDRSITFISELEQGKKGFSLFTLAKLCSAMNIEPAVLFFPKDYSPAENKDISNVFSDFKDVLHSMELKYNITS